MQQRKVSDIVDIQVTREHQNAHRRLKADVARSIGDLRELAERARHLFQLHPATHELGQAALFLGLAEDDARQALEWMKRLAGGWTPSDDAITAVTRNHAYG